MHTPLIPPKAMPRLLLILAHISHKVASICWGTPFRVHPHYIARPVVRHRRTTGYWAETPSAFCKPHGLTSWARVEIRVVRGQKKKKIRGRAKAQEGRVSNYKNLNLNAFAPSERTHPLVNTQGVAHVVRLPWAGCLLALQAVAPQRFSSNL